MLLRRVVSGAVPVGVALIAYLHAQAIGALVDGSTAASIAPFAEARAGQPSFEMSDAGKTAAALLERNPFDHAAGSLVPRDVSAGASDEDMTLDLASALTAPDCDDLRAVATVRGKDDDGSFAAFVTRDAKLLRKAGDEVAGRRVLFVGADRAWLAKGGAVCQARVFAGPELAQASAPVSGTPLNGQTALEKEVTGKIRKVGTNEYEIERSGIDRFLEAQAELMRTPLVPEKQGDQVVGFRLTRVKPGSVLAAIGLETNDRLTAINGVEVTNTERMLEAYARIRGSAADRLTLTLVRHGKTQNIDYRVR